MAATLVFGMKYEHKLPEGLKNYQEALRGSPFHLFKRTYADGMTCFYLILRDHIHSIEGERAFEIDEDLLETRPSSHLDGVIFCMADSLPDFRGNWILIAPGESKEETLFYPNQKPS